MPSRIFAKSWRAGVALVAGLLGLGLASGPADALPGWSGSTQISGVGHRGQGAGVALVNLDRNRRPEMVLMAYDNPRGANSFRYKIGWNVTAQGFATSWSRYIQVPGVGNEGQGAGIYFVNLDRNRRPEMVLMAYDNPRGANNFRYRIGWNVGSNGRAASWSNYVRIPGVGHEGDGADVAFVNLDSNARPEMVLMAYDDPSGGNSFRYKIGWNVGSNGRAASWSGMIQVGGVGNLGQGAGMAFVNLDRNARPEMVLMAYDNPSGSNTFRYRVGWNVRSNGRASSWSGYVTVPGLGWEGEGADLEIYDIDGNNRLDMILMSYDAPSGANSFRYRIGWDMQVVRDFLISIDALGHSDYVSAAQVPTSIATQTAANLYQLADPLLLQTAYEAILEYVNDCHARPAAHTGELANPAAVTFYDVLTQSDLMVAAVAWFVDANMRWTSDGTNQTILNTQMGLNYHPGWDFPIPANYTIRYTGDAAFGTPARFHGDCEDHAILRAALLRALGFHPDYIWNVIDNPVTHEYNVVLYKGAFRLMDYGPITRWLQTHTWDSHRSYYGYNEIRSSRYVGSDQHNALVNHGNNYPAGGPSCRAWNYHNYYRDTCR